MSTGSDAPVDPRFANLDAGGTIELCSSLAEYGEAGGLSRDLMLQVGRFAESRYGDDLEVLVAVGRMYLLGGEAALSRKALVRAGQLGLDEARIIPLLDQALEQLDDPRTSEQALRDAPSDPPGPPSSKGETRRPAGTGPRPAGATPRTGLTTTPRSRIADEPPPSPSDLPAKPGPKVPSVKVTWDVPGRSYTPTTPMLRMPGHGPSRPTTPLPVQRARVTPADLRQTTPVGLARAAAAARPVDDEVPSQGRPVRTEISRRITRGHDDGNGNGAISSPPPPVSGPAPAAPAPANLPPPTRIRILDPDDERRKLDPYELIGELASGGMATVYLGRLGGAGGFSRFVAIKQLHPHLAREEQFVQMFLDEARLAAGIHNAHVVPILEVGMSKAGYFLVMEFIEGDTLAGLTLRMLHRAADEGAGAPTRVPAPVALRIVLDTLAGLHAAHQLTDAEGVHLGLVHRDCTPQNILVGVDGSARLTDFGVARAASRLAITRPQQVKGKVAYLSPEQAHAMDLDRRSDIFTLGIVLWEALAGRSLFQADNEAVTLSRVVSGPIPAVRSFVPDLPAALDDVCRRALHRDRNKRFRTAAEMADALEQAAEGVGVASPRELGRFVEATMGADLIAQRDAVRAGMMPSSKGAHPSRPPPSIRGSGAGIAARQAPEPSPLPTPPPPVAEEAPPGRAAIPPPPSPPAEETPAPPAIPAAASPEPARPETPPAEQAAPEPPAPTLQALVRRITGSKMSTARGVTLAVLLVVVLTAPIWIKITQRIMRRPAAGALDAPSPPGTAAPGLRTPAPVAATRAQPAWDEGDWLPEAGVGQGDPSASPSVPAAPSVTPTAR